MMRNNYANTPSTSGLPEEKHKSYSNLKLPSGELPNAQFLNDCVQYLVKNFPKESEVLNIHSILNSPQTLEYLVKHSVNEFTKEGRGDEYLQSFDICFEARQEGVKDLLTLVNQDCSLRFSQDDLVCDLLAGNGYINRICNHSLSESEQPRFVNSDISYFMFQNCLKLGLFSLWQSADNLFWLLPNSVDGVIFAYGTHYIPKRVRLQAVCEAKRILKQGGRFVMHDFEQDSSVAAWFRDVVSPFSKTGHNHSHFTKEEMLALAKKAGLRDIKIEYIDDPFVVKASTEQEALSLLARYVFKAYGLSKLNGNIQEVLTLLDKHFKIYTRQLNKAEFEARIIRNALVCHGTKTN
jgi:SAM-dependent methyltransferase